MGCLRWWHLPSDRLGFLRSCRQAIGLARSGYNSPGYQRQSGDGPKEYRQGDEKAAQRFPPETDDTAALHRQMTKRIHVAEQKTAAPISHVRYHNPRSNQEGAFMQMFLIYCSPTPPTSTGNPGERSGPVPACRGGTCGSALPPQPESPYFAVCAATAAAFPGPPTAWILGILSSTGGRGGKGACGSV